MKNNVINVKIEFEDQPVVHAKGLKNMKEFDNTIQDFRTKIFGKKK